MSLSRNILYKKNILLPVSHSHKNWFIYPVIRSFVLITHNNHFKIKKLLQELIQLVFFRGYNCHLITWEKSI